MSLSPSRFDWFAGFRLQADILYFIVSLPPLTNKSHQLASAGLRRTNAEKEGAEKEGTAKPFLFESQNL